jgi:hypothetical protein
MSSDAEVARQGGERRYRELYKVDDLRFSEWFDDP